MSAPRDRRKPSWILGLLLILLLLGAVGFGGYSVLQAAFQPRMSDAKAAKEAAQAPASTPASPDTPAQESAADTRPEEEPAVSAQPQQPEASRVTLMAVGDNLIHNCVYWSAETPDGGYDFSSFYDDIRPIAEQYDIACIHQETPLVKNRSLISSYPVFGTPVEVADAIAGAAFDVVTLASNHCYDKLETGVTDTLSYFHDNFPEIITLGEYASEAESEKIPILEKNGIRIAMLNFTYGFNNSAPAQSWMVDTLFSRDTVCARVSQAKQTADFVIVFPHWGTEDTFSADDNQRSWAQSLADAGADLIIGGHTHTLQPVELLTASDGRDVPVYYSLGNFLSHQTEKINLLGGMASVTIVKDDSGTWAETYDLQPTVNVVLRNPETDWYSYRPMLLADYTPELAAQNRFSECTVEAMQELYESIVG